MNADERVLADGRVLRLGAVTVEDAAAVVDYVDRVGAETDYLTFGPGEYELTVAQEERYLENFLRGRHNLMIKGEVDGALVALLSIRRERRPRLAHLGELGISVLKDHWGLGIGRHLMDKALAWSRAVGVRKLNLRVRCDNERAHRLYLRYGFVDEGVCARGLKVRGRFFDETLMGLCLD